MKLASLASNISKKIGFPDCSCEAIAERQKSRNLRILAFFFTCLQKQRFIGYFPKIIKVWKRAFTIGLELYFGAYWVMKQAGKEKSTKSLLKVSNRETRFFCWGKFFAFLVAKPSISVLGYMKGCRKILLRNFGADRQLFKKTVLGIVEGQTLLEKLLLLRLYFYP